jgi:hypothetical protein
MFGFARLPVKWIADPPALGVKIMAKKNVLTFNGEELESKSWQKLALSGKLKEHYDTLQEARQAFEAELIQAIKARIKINEAKHEVRLGFRFGPSYVVCDKVGTSTPKGALAL